MLGKDVFKSKMNELLMAFPNWKINNNDPTTMKFWYGKFKKMSNKDFNDMVDNYIGGEQFAPTIKGLKEYDISAKKSRDQIEHEKMLKEMGYFDD